MKVRQERASDRAAIYRVNEAAFESEAEAHLVDRLRDQVDGTISLVAEGSEGVVGHIMFSPVALGEGINVAGLAPMAVLPAQQGRGLGSALVKAGLEACRVAGYVAVVVLGHPQFYPKFGFRPAGQFAICSQYPVPPEVFMALELEAGSLAGVAGTAVYAEAFNGL